MGHAQEIRSELSEECRKEHNQGLLRFVNRAQLLTFLECVKNNRQHRGQLEERMRNAWGSFVDDFVTWIDGLDCLHIDKARIWSLVGILVQSGVIPQPSTISRLRPWLEYYKLNCKSYRYITTSSFMSGASENCLKQSEKGILLFIERAQELVALECEPVDPTIRINKWKQFVVDFADWLDNLEDGECRNRQKAGIWSLIRVLTIMKVLPSVELPEPDKRKKRYWLLHYRNCHHPGPERWDKNKIQQISNEAGRLLQWVEPDDRIPLFLRLNGCEDVTIQNKGLLNALKMYGKATVENKQLDRIALIHILAYSTDEMMAMIKEDVDERTHRKFYDRMREDDMWDTWSLMRSDETRQRFANNQQGPRK